MREIGRMVWSVVTLQMVCWKARVALVLLALGFLLDLWRHW